MRTHLRAGAAATTGLLLGGLAIAGAVALVTAPLTPRLAVAQTVVNPHDQSVSGTSPRATSAVKRGYDPAR